MARSNLSLTRLFALLGRELTETELRERLFRTKVEVDAYQGTEVTVEVMADRLDLLDEGGLAWELQGARGEATGLPVAELQPPLPQVEARVNASVDPLRSELAMAVVVAPEGSAGLDAGLLEEVVRYQELLHASLGRGRQSASLGLYPLDRLRPPFHYAMEPMGQVRFVPLGGTGELGAEEFYRTHPMAAKYGALGHRETSCLTLRDDDRTVLSLPPVLNAAGAGEIAPGGRRVLLEATGTRRSRTREMVGYMLVPFLARGWKAHPVPVHGPQGTVDGTEVLAPRRVPVAASALTTLLGSRLTSTEIEHALLSSRLGVERPSGTLMALVPPWRADILASVDLAEEVAIARGYATFTPILPPSTTMGRRRPERRFEQRVGSVMLGMGYQELNTQVLLSGPSLGRFHPLEESLALRNPISQEYSHVRSVLRASLLDALARNTGSGYPQQVFEVGPVLTRDPKAETGSRTETHLALVDAGEGAGFARAAAVADRLFSLLGFEAPREPTEVLGAVPGRAARLRIAGETIALLGEVHPSVLGELHLQVPVCWVEMDLTKLERLGGLQHVGRDGEARP